MTSLVETIEAAIFENFAPIGVGSSDETMATLIRLRIEREADLQKIFSVLGLSRDRNTADEAVEIIREILLVLTQYESELSK